MATNQRYVTMWRKTGEKILDWDFQVCENLLEVERIVDIITAQGVHQYSTYPIGDRVLEFSSTY